MSNTSGSAGIGNGIQGLRTNLMARDPGRSHSSWAAPPNTQSTNSIPAPGIFGIGGKSVALYTRNGTRWDPLESREQGWGKGTEENQGETEHSAPKGKTKDGAEPSLLTLHREKAKSGNISVGCSPAPVFNKMLLLRREVFMIIKLQLMELQLTEMNQPCQNHPPKTPEQTFPDKSKGTATPGISYFGPWIKN